MYHLTSAQTKASHAVTTLWSLFCPHELPADSEWGPKICKISFCQILSTYSARMKSKMQTTKHVFHSRSHAGFAFPLKLVWVLDVFFIDWLRIREKLRWCKVNFLILVYYLNFIFVNNVISKGFHFFTSLMESLCCNSLGVKRNTAWALRQEHSLTFC